MNKKAIHEYLLKELKSRTPNNSQLVNELSDILNLGKEAIYRRMRGEVQFSIEDLFVISKKMGLSMDNLVGISDLKRPFIFKMANFANPKEIDYKLINEIVEFLDTIKSNPKTEMGTAAKLIPDALHLNYPYITRFYLFKWIYQYDNQTPVKKFDQIKGSDRILEILFNMTNLLQHIKKSYYIFDKRIFEYLVEDIKYFNSIGLINNNDIQLLKNDLFACLNEIEQMAVKGINKSGNEMEIYLSNLNFEAGFSYIKSDKHKLSNIRAFTMYDISSSDSVAFDNSMQWMQSLKRASTLISVSSEIQRMNFFRNQYDIVNTL